MTNLSSESLHRHMPEPVSLGTQKWTFAYEALRAVYYGAELTFARVLNVPVSEDIWPGDAIELFSLLFFAKSPYTGEFVQPGEVFEHMRCETLRLCSGNFSAKDYMIDELNFFLEFDGPFPSSFGYEDELLLTDELDW